jgi:transcriptional regulator with XRE-family HTH domain
MDPGLAPNPLATLGERLRQARLERGLSQDALAQPEFTKSYVSAVERGKARPSLKALELMARRLGIPLS